MPYRQNALALYKQGPARITAVGDKIAILLPSGSSKNVREKDLTPLHPGPVTDFQLLKAQPQGDIPGACELLEGESATLAEFAELAYDSYTPDTAWATWKLLADGLWLEGTPEQIRPRPTEQVQQIQAERDAKAAAKQAWTDFIQRIKDSKLQPDDSKKLNEVAILANAREGKSKILEALGISQTPQQAHALLLKLKLWRDHDNPHPKRRGVALSDPELPVPELPDEPRLDLTHLAAYAIDDEHSTDPDDAISLDGDRLWVHVADVAALVRSDDPLDQEARQRASNLYLPEGTIHMLPPAVTEQLALGLSDTSPALSIGIRLDAESQIIDTEIALSRVRVTRLSYAEAETQLDQAPFQQLQEKLLGFRARRRAQGSAKIQLPEVAVHVQGQGRDSQIQIKPLPAYASRELVADAMLLAGEAVGRYALQHQINFPYSTQAPPETPSQPKTLSEMYHYRRQFKRSQMRGDASPHFGLGLDVYAQVTSPLRRYLDLVCHQQLRAHLRGEPGINGEQLLERIGAYESHIDDMRRAERDSVMHWKLAWLLRQMRKNNGYSCQGTIATHRGKRGIVLIPELALESGVAGLDKTPLDSDVQLQLNGVDFPELLAKFRTQ